MLNRSRAEFKFRMIKSNLKLTRAPLRAGTTKLIRDKR